MEDARDVWMSNRRVIEEALDICEDFDDECKMPVDDICICQDCGECGGIL